MISFLPYVAAPDRDHQSIQVKQNLDSILNREGGGMAVKREKVWLWWQDLSF